MTFETILTPDEAAFVDSRKQVTYRELSQQVDRCALGLENVFYENPKADSVAVVAVPDPRLQERACVCVILKPRAGDLTMDEMRTCLEEKGVAKQYWPELLEASRTSRGRRAGRSGSSSCATR
ncbi:MAG TPA: hypothetical protein VK964_12390 [Nocardioidaceae bacterium]|nr:hypothetical protein [Nocardioidaceae bacterium]